MKGHVLSIINGGMDRMNNIITLSQGDGGKQTRKLIQQLFYHYFDNPLLLSGQDSAVIDSFDGKLAFTTDSFVVKPVFFNGGDIGKLAVCGTVNDLAVSGAKPLYISSGFVIEEGFLYSDLVKIVQSMKAMCEECGALIVTGDTKVVEKGGLDGIYINTSGIGSIMSGFEPKPLVAGDQIIVSGTIGEHGTTIAINRYHLNIEGKISSDCAPLYSVVNALKEYAASIKMMRDPTRGGLATVLHEFALDSGLGMHLFKQQIPISDGVRSVTHLLGLDPYYMACEGRMVLVVSEKESQAIVRKLQSLEVSKDAAIIGCVVNDSKGKVYVENEYGGKRIISDYDGIMLPRIC